MNSRERQRIVNMISETNEERQRLHITPRKRIVQKFAKRCEELHTTRTAVLEALMESFSSDVDESTE